MNLTLIVKTKPSDIGGLYKGSLLFKNPCEKLKVEYFLNGKIISPLVEGAHVNLILRFSPEEEYVIDGIYPAAVTFVPERIRYILFLSLPLIYGNIFVMKAKDSYGMSNFKEVSLGVIGSLSDKSLDLIFN